MVLREAKPLSRMIFRNKRLVTALVAVVVAAISTPIAPADEGGATIASAPTLTWGAPQDGIGGENFAGTLPPGYGGRTFWRVPTFAGDEITLSLSLASLGGCFVNRLALFDPTVTDATVGSAGAAGIDTGLRPTTDTGNCVNTLTSRLRWTHVPFTGLATLWAGIGSEAPTFTFVATVKHRTLVQLATVPRTITSPAGEVLLRARVTSAAGSPSGVCAFDRRADARGRWLQVQRAELANGSCSAPIAAAAKDSVMFRVRYLPDPTWLPSQAVTPRVLIG